MSELTWESWLQKYTPNMGELYKYAKSPLANDPGDRQNDTERAIHNADEAGRLRADVESYLSQATAQAVLACRDLHPNLNADERKTIVKDSVRGIRRVVDGLEITEMTIKNRIFANLNANKNGLR